MPAVLSRALAAYDRALTSFLYRMNVYLGSRDGFSHSVTISIAWVAGAYLLDFYPAARPASAALIFAYLTFATAFSFITQFNITHVAEAATRIAEESRVRAEAADDQTLLILERMTGADADAREVLTALAQALENQGHMLEAVVEISRREIALTSTIEDAVERIELLIKETQDRHVENQKLIRALYRGTRPLVTVAVAEGAKVKRAKRAAKTAPKRAPRGE